MKKHKKAFTILELLVVIVISAVLITIVLPRIISYTKEARYKACRGQIAIINEQVDLYYVQVGEWPRADLMDLVWDTDRFPDGMPRCPSTGYFYWTYEDTHRVGGHDEDNPESHKELGYMTIGDSTLDSQGYLAGMLQREFDVESNQYALVRYGDYRYELMEDGKTWKKVSFKKYYYNAYGSLKLEAEYYDIKYDESNRMKSKKVITKDRRGHIKSDSLYEHYYDAEGVRRTRSVDTDVYYPASEGQLVQYKTKRVMHYDPAAKVYTGFTQTSTDAGGTNKYGELEVSFDLLWDEGPNAGKVKNKTITYMAYEGDTKYITRIHAFEDIKYDLNGRQLSYTMYKEDGGGKIGKVEYESGEFTTEGLRTSQTFIYSDYIPPTEPGAEGTYEYAGERHTPITKFDFEKNRAEAYQRNTTAAGDVEKRGYYMEYDEYGRQKFARYVFRNEDNTISSIVENTNRSYDPTTGLFTGGNQTVYNPDKSISMEKTSRDFQYDSAGRLTAYTVEAYHKSDDKTTTFEFSNRTYEGPLGGGINTMTGYRRKKTETIDGKKQLLYDYDLRNIRRNINGGMTSYSWTKYKADGTVDGELENTCPPVCPHEPKW